MKNVKVEATRNFALIGHSGDGKTSLGEALLQIGVGDATPRPAQPQGEQVGGDDHRDAAPRARCSNWSASMARLVGSAPAT